MRPPVPADVSVDNTTGETANDVPALVDKEDQLPAGAAATAPAPAPTSDSSESSSAEEEVEVKAGEATSEPAAVSDLTGTVDKEVSVEDEVPPAGEKGGELRHQSA